MSWVMGDIAGHCALRPQPAYLGIAIAAAGLMSIVLIRETRDYVTLETASAPGAADRPPSLGRIFYVTSAGNLSLFATCRAGPVNNLNDGMSWGLYPLFFSAHGLDVESIGVTKAVYPMAGGSRRSGRACSPNASAARG